MPPSRIKYSRARRNRPVLLFGGGGGGGGGGGLEPADVGRIGRLGGIGPALLAGGIEVGGAV